jgi:hypothetical protein
MSKEADRLYLALTVDEISVVDEPANEKQIIVAKRKEQEMSTAAAAQTPDKAPAIENDEPVEAAGAEVVQTEVDDGTPDEVVEALKNLVANAAAIAKAKKPYKAKPDKLPPFLKAMEEKLQKAGMGKGEIAKALEAAKASFGSSGLFTDEPVAKTTDEPAAKTTPEPEVPDEDELVMKTLEAIAKAKSFTPGRIKKLVQAITNLDALLDELGIDKAAFGPSGLVATGTAAMSQPPIMDAAGTGGAGKPGNPIKKGKGEPEPTPEITAEVIAEAIVKALDPITKQVSEVAERVESIEKARAPSTQPGGLGGDGAEEPVSKNKRLWAGVL